MHTIATKGVMSTVNTTDTIDAVDSTGTEMPYRYGRHSYSKYYRHTGTLDNIDTMYTTGIVGTIDIL